MGMVTMFGGETPKGIQEMLADKAYLDEAIQKVLSVGSMSNLIGGMGKEGAKKLFAKSIGDKPKYNLSIDEKMKLLDVIESLQA